MSTYIHTTLSVGNFSLIPPDLKRRLHVMKRTQSDNVTSCQHATASQHRRGTTLCMAHGWRSLASYDDQDCRSKCGTKSCHETLRIRCTCSCNTENNQSHHHIHTSDMGTSIFFLYVVSFFSFFFVLSRTGITRTCGPRQHPSDQTPCRWKHVASLRQSN